MTTRLIGWINSVLGKDPDEPALIAEGSFPRAEGNRRAAPCEAPSPGCETLPVFTSRPSPIVHEATFDDGVDRVVAVGRPGRRAWKQTVVASRKRQ